MFRKKAPEKQQSSPNLTPTGSFSSPTTSQSSPLPVTAETDLLRLHPNVEEWTEQHIFPFILQLGLPRDVAQKFVNEQIKGPHLYVLDNAILKEDFGITALHHRLTLLLAIQKIKEAGGKYSPSITLSLVASAPALKAMTEKEKEDVVMEKLKAQLENPEQVPEENVRQAAQNLCVKKNLKEKYLNKDFEAIKQLFQSLPGETKSKGGFMASAAPNLASTSQSTATSAAPEEEDPIVLAEKLEHTVDGYKLKENIKIKLVIAEIANNQTQKTLRAVAAPIMTALNTSPTFGLCHSALIIGPWYIEWNNSSLAIPRKCYSNAAIMAVDVQTHLVKQDLDLVIDRLSDVIIRWNTTKTYDKNNTNCQNFVEDVLASLGVNINFKGVLADFLTALKEKGQCKMKYKVPAEVRETFKITTPKLKFKSHKELDTFVNSLLEKDPLFPENYPNDYFLLKSFDRAFWLRHFKHTLDACYKDHDCPFEDPSKSSFLRDWF